MKCPTCGYIGFEASDRCRNCGYDFALSPSTPAEAPELAMKTDQTEGALRELDIQLAPAAPAVRGQARVAPERQPDIDKVLSNLDRVIGEAAAPDLPLFDDAADQAALPPLVDSTAPPRRPLAVRRATPDPSRLRARTPRPQSDTPRAMELPLPDADEPAPADARGGDRAATPDDANTAPPLHRIAAAVLDLTIVGGIDVAVVYFTLKLCGLTSADVLLLPAVPLLAFFVIVNGGYLAAFTAAGGQTIGKMALGLKVVGRADQPVSSGLAVVRALGCLASVASLGLGFLPALLGGDGRAFEDRLADTRVVRITA